MQRLLRIGFSVLFSIFAIGAFFVIKSKVQDTKKAGSEETPVNTHQAEMERYVYTYTPDEQTENRETFTPETVLNGNTEGLLDCFFESGYLFADLFTRSASVCGIAEKDGTRSPDSLYLSVPLLYHLDYKNHPAFNEFLNRDDALSALDKKAKQIIESDITFGDVKLKAIIDQHFFNKKDIDRKAVFEDYPSIKELVEARNGQ